MELKESTSYSYFNLHPITVQTGCNQGQMTVQRGSKKGQARIKNTTQQKHILTIIVWINIGIIYQHNGIILNKICYICIILIKINAIYNSCTNQLYTHSCNDFKWNQSGIIKKDIFTMFTIIQLYYCQFNESVCKMHEIHQIYDAIHNLRLIITLFNVIDTTVNQFEILIAIYMIADRVIYCSSWYIS